MNDTPAIDDSLPTPPPRPNGFNTEGETFGHYQVLRREDGTLWELGRGAMGVTYKAFDTNLRCHVALKVISTDYLHSDLAGQRFVREARVAARLRHPNIASVYHLGVDPQGFFYSMEFIDGETLEDTVARTGPLPVETVLHVGLQVARALAAASRQGLIHRDIKPANVMVLRENEEGDDRLSVKVIDFGLARTYAPEDSAPQLTATGFVGTPLYASPEQLEEQDLDVRSDIYSLGVTMWILLVGRPPFEGKMTQVITQHLHAPPPWWQLPACPEPVRNLLEKMLQKNRLQRYQSAGELRQAIENCLRAVSTRADLLLPAEGPDPGETLRIPPAEARPAKRPATTAGGTPATVSPTGTVTEHLGAAARTLFAQAAATERRKFLWPAAAVAGAVLLLGGVMLSRSGAPPAPTPPKPSAAAVPLPPATVVAAEPPPVLAPTPTLAPSSAPTPAPTPPPTPVPTPFPTATPPLAAAALDTPAPTPSVVARDTPTPTPARPVPASSVPEPTPPPLVTPPSPTASGLDSLDGSPADSATVAPTTAASQAADTPAPSPEVADDAHEEAGKDASPTPTPQAKSGSSSGKSSRSHHSARATPTPAPNFFQRLFGIKPKPSPTPKKGR